MFGGHVCLNTVVGKLSREYLEAVLANREVYDHWGVTRMFRSATMVDNNGCAMIYDIGDGLCAAHAEHAMGGTSAVAVFYATELQSTREAINQEALSFLNHG